MAEVLKYPKRLIEVDLPIREISAHARREKSIRHGHISTLHMWWARRPLAACRAVACASLWFDPVDPSCPERFRVGARAALSKVRGGLANEDDGALRAALFKFIADFSNWDAANSDVFLDIAREITAAAYPDGDPVVIDPFAGGGAMPVEAARIGAEPTASDLNPVAVMLNRVALETAPRFGSRLSELVRSFGREVGERALQVLQEFYPPDPDGARPIAYIWARTVRCEGPACGTSIPLLRSLWLCKKSNRPSALRLIVNRQKTEVRIEVFAPKTAQDVGPATVHLGSVVCPVCGFTTKKEQVRAQLRARRGGTNDAVLACVVTVRTDRPGRFYRPATEHDYTAMVKAQARLATLPPAARGLSPVPDEAIPQLKVWKNNPIRVHLYGMTSWGDLFSHRQALALATFSQLIRDVTAKPLSPMDDPDLRRAAHTCLALALSRLIDRTCSLCTWRPQADQEKVEHVFTRQALSMTWDFAEGSPISDGTASWQDAYEAPAQFIEVTAGAIPKGGTVLWCDAANLPLPDDSASVLLTDPPYYDAVPYADLADFFYVWLRRTLPEHPDASMDLTETPKAQECVVDEGRGKSKAFFEAAMTAALSDARRVVQPSGIGVVVFAHKTTTGWEAILQALLSAGWIVTASWPLDTEMATRLRARNSAALASSIHLVCRPRENADGSLREQDVGSWRAVLAQLPLRIHDWMPRLAAEGVVGADAIFACLGPALEIFSQHSRVEKASGETVTLREYLEEVWAAVAREALSLMFDGADASGLEEDARLTAMWLWTLGGGDVTEAGASAEQEEEASANESEEQGRGQAVGFVLEYDAARKIAQGLGAHLDKLTDVVEVKGDKARLLAVSERAKHLFGKEDLAPDAPKQKKAKTSKKQLGLFAEIEAAEKQGLLGAGGVPKVGETTLDKVHQSMILFGAGRSEALKRFIVEEGVGKDGRFWKLAQSLSALYPSGSEEKRWVDGVLARKKSLGFG